MTRENIITSLIAFDAPVAELRAALATLDWDAAPVAILGRRDVVAVLRRYEAGEIDADDVAAWANLVECREDIEFEARHIEAIADSLYDLANPDLQGPLDQIAPDILDGLGG